MKRLFLFLGSILVLYVIYVDLTKGTLPSANEPAEEVMAKTEEHLSYFEKQVSSGETVLSIVEKKLNSPLSVSIDEVISDFKRLNNGLKPEKIQSGNTYRFPDYSTKIQSP